MHGVRSSQNYTARSEREPNHTVSGNFQIRFALGRDLNNPTLTRKRSGYVQVSILVEGHALWAT